MQKLSKTIKSEVNQFPRLTWHHLHINHGAADFELNARAEMNLVKPSDSGTADSVVHSEKLRKDTFGSEHSLISQMGREFDSELDSFISDSEILTDEFTVKADSENAPVKLVLSSAAENGAVRDIVIHACENSRSTFIISAESENVRGPVLGVRVRVFAEENAYVHLVSVNLLPSDSIFFDAVSTLVLDNAHVEVTQIQLGAKKSFSGVRHTLAGYRASNSGQLAYIAKDNNELDINYVTHQIAKETESLFVTEGVVSGNAKKTWRGTIDFVKGCKDSKGNENESVLLLSPSAENKSLPVILCDEEAVEGSHGTSIGKLGKDVLFYLESHGVSKEEAVRLMVKAKVNSVCRHIPDEELVQKIESFVEGVSL